MAAGSIVVDLLMRTGAFETDTARAGKALKKFQKQAEDVGKTIGVSLVAGATAAAAAFEVLVLGAANFKDLEEQTGATAEDLASLAIVASVAGTSVADIAGQANKLTKNLSGVDDESKAAGAALAALGIPIADFKNLDPVGQIDALSKAFNGFTDGSAKTAVAMALFGKSGAQMLNVFKELQAEGGRNAILTQQQIELADDFADRQTKATATIKAYAQAGATDLLPMLNDLTIATKEVIAEFVGIDTAGKKLASESPVKEFAETAANVLAFLVDAGQGVVRIFQAVGLTIGAVAAEGGALLRGQLGEARQISIDAKQDIENVLSAELFSQRIARIRAAAAKAAGGDPNQSSAETARLARKPALEFKGAVKKDKAGKTPGQSEAERYLENLQKQEDKLKELSVYEQALADIQAKRIKGITPALEAQILAEARSLDLAKQVKEFRDGEVQTTTKRAKAQLEELDATIKGNAEMQKEIDLLGLSEEQLQAVELQRIRVTKAEKELTLAKLEATTVSEQQLQVLQAEIKALGEREKLLTDRADKVVDVNAQEAAAKTGDTYKDTLSDSIADGMLDGFRRGQSFSDIVLNELKAQFAKTVLSPLIKPVVDQSNKMIADLFGKLGGFFTNTGMATNTTGTSLPTAGGAAGGTNFVERDMLTILHKGEAVVPKAFNPATGGGGVTIINQASGVQVRPAGKDAEGNPRLIVEQILDQASQRGAADFQSGNGPMALAARGRLGLGAGSLPKRG